MKATIFSTDQITTVDGVPCRIWNGLTEKGVHFFAFIHRVAAPVGNGMEAEFEREFRDAGQPEPEAMRDALGTLPFAVSMEGQ